MRNKKGDKARVERLIELTNELEKRDLALKQESKQLEKLRTALDERERRLAEVERTGKTTNRQPTPESEIALEESILKGRPAAEPLQPAPAKPVATTETITEINTILKSIFNDYSSSVHQISTQLSTVTAAMMCAAVTCVLENRGFDAKDVFIEEMEKMLQTGGLGGVCPTPAPQAQPAPVSAPMPQAPVAANVDEDESAGEEEDEPTAEREEDGILHIASAEDFRKLGEYGFRNDETIVRVSLPEGVEQLPGSFFYGCRKLEEVWLPNSLKEIGPYAFYGCEQLQAVHMSEKAQLQDIGEYAFAMCSALETFSVPAAVETIGTSVFRFCSSLAKLSFVKDGKLRSIGSHLLQNCSALEKLRLPDSITVIPTSMFYGCSALKKVTAKGVDTIEDYAFYGNENLRTIRIRTKKAIAAQAFEGCDPSLEIEYLNY